MDFTPLVVLSSFLAGYLAIGSIAAGVAKRLDPSDQETGFLIPFWLPILGIYCVVSPFMWLYDSIAHGKMPSLPKRKTPAQKVLSYSQAPVKVLSEIVAQRIMSQPEMLDLYRPNGDYQWVWVSQDKKVEVYTQASYRSDGACDGIKLVRVNGKDVEAEKDIILKALKEALNYNKMKKEADAEAERQRKALDAVETLLLSPEPAEHPMGSHKL